MRRILVTTVAFFLVVSAATAAEFQLEPTQSPDAPFRLFNTQNVYTLLKLDTRSGQIWQVQWGDSDHRFTEAINDKPLVAGGRSGRFTLYATSNIYTFILLDQDTGETWHVQWGKPNDRFLLPIH
jgi:hypothetical protein